MLILDRYFKELETYINVFSKKDIYKNRTIKNCPNCDAAEYIKYGSYKGIQRYKCKKCGKTFSNTTNSLWSYSKKDPTKWLKFIEYIIERRSLRFCSKKLDISLVTAFYWRHKILHGLTFDSIPDKISGNVYISKKLVPENFKGSRKITKNVRHNIWVVGAKGNEDSMIAKPISRGFWDLQNFNKKIYTIIDKKSYLIPYGDRYISLVATTHNKKKIQVVNDEHKIKWFPNNLENWLKKYSGIATKYLDEYLSLFILFNIDKKINYIDLFEKLILENRFIKIKEIGIEKRA